LHDHIAMSSATVAMLASCISGVPFSMTVHGLELLSAEQWALARKIAASAATVCVSSFGRGQCMLATAPEHWHKLHVIRCGLDGTFLNAVSLPVPDVPRLVCIGRLSPEKGQVLLVHAAAQIRQRGMMAEIVLVGDGPSRSVIERAARELAVDDLVRLVGWQSSEDVRRWIQSSRALVVPSFSEGIPVVLLEAMALERPVIATHVGGVSELVRRRENGWLVPAGSVEDLAAAILEALGTSVQELRRMGQRGRQLILEQHDLATEVGKLVELFERAMRRDPRPRAARNSRRESP